MTGTPKRIYVQRSGLEILERLKSKMDSVGTRSAQISLREIKNSVAYVRATDDDKCGDCPNGPGGGKLETYDIDCGECKRFYADLKVKL